MIALAKTGPGPDRLELLDRSEPEPEPADVVVAIAVTGVCGSDLHLWRGSLPHVERAYPMWLGHEYAGTVVAVGHGVDRRWLGRRVTAEPSAGCGACWTCDRGRPNRCVRRRFDGGGFAPFVRVPAHRLHELPERVPMTVGALVEPLACVVHALVDVTPIRLEDVGVVVGPGPIGLLAAFVIEALGGHPIVVGRPSSPFRLDLARSLGLEVVLADEAAEHVEVRTAGRGADVVVGCAGGAGAFRSGVDLLRPGGRYVELALGSPHVSVTPDELATRELHLSGAIGHTPAAWRHVLSMLADGRLDGGRLEKLVTAREPLTDWRAAFGAAEGRRAGKVLLEPHAMDP